MEDPTRKIRIRPCQRARYEDLFFRVADAVVLIDPLKFAIQDCNEQFARLSGLKPEACAGKAVADWILPTQLEEFKKMLRVVGRRYFVQTWENFWHVNGANVEVSVTGCMLQLNDGSELMQLTIRDVTREREAEKIITNHMKSLASANSKLEKSSGIDSLTGLPNLRGLRDRLASESARAAKYGSRYTLVMIEMDRPTKEAVRSAAEVIRTSCSLVEFVARYGDEKFVVLVPEMDIASVRDLAARVQSAARGKISQVLSIGMACYPDAGTTDDDVLRAAVVSLNLAKRNGAGGIHAPPIPVKKVS